MATVPDNIKKNVRAVLLSKVGGILVSDFCKDYKNLLKEQLNLRQLGFDNLNSLIKAMPDVVRLEFSERDLAYKMFGIVDPNTYTPLAAKIAADSSPDKAVKRKGRSGHKKLRNPISNDSNYVDFVPNARGHYTLCYQRYKESDDITKEVLEEKYSVFPGFYEVHMIPRMIFVRFTKKESAVECLELFSSDLGMKIADEKLPSRGSNQKNNKSQKDNDDVTASRKKSGNAEDKDVIEIYIGNLDSSVTQDEVKELCIEFSPTDVRVKQGKNDSNKVFAFAGFKDTESAQRCVDKLDKMSHKGRELNVRIASAEGPPQNQQKSKREPEEPSAPVGGKISWKSFGNTKSGSTGISTLDDDEECWDSANKNASTSVNKISWKSAVNHTNDHSSIENTCSQNSSSFGQNKSSFGQTTSSFGQNTFSSIQSPPVLKGSEGRREGSGKPVKLYFGNLHSSITKEDFTDLVKNFSPSEIKLISNGNKVYGFVTVNSKSAAEECVNRFNQMDYKGRKITCKESNPDSTKSKGSSQSEGNVPSHFPRSDTSRHNGELSVFDNNDNAWDAENNNSAKSGIIQTNSDVSARLGRLSIQTDDFQQTRQSAISPSLVQQRTFKGQSKQKHSPNFNKSNQTIILNSENSRNLRKPMEDFSDNPPLEPAVVDEMPPLEPAIAEEMPPLERISYNRNPSIVNVWVANFPYFETEDDLMEVYEPLGAVDITMVNSSNTAKTTGAIIHFVDEATADDAILQTHQMIYKERLLWVQIYETDPEKRTNVGGVNLSISVKAESGGSRSVSVRKSPGRQGGMKGATSCESIKSTGSSGGVGKSFFNLMHTYKIVMNKLGTRARDVVFKPFEAIMIYITSVYDENCFWGQVIRDDSTLLDLENKIEELQDPNVKIGPTKGLGRCAAKIDDEWFRSWVVADRGDFTVEVFNVDYGNTAVINKRNVALTLPDVWDLQPVVRPFRIKDGTPMVNKEMEQTLVYAQVTGSNADDTGFLTEVKITGFPQ